MVISLERVKRLNERNNVYYLRVPESEWAKVSMRIIWSPRKQETKMPEMLRAVKKGKRNDWTSVLAWPILQLPWRLTSLSDHYFCTMI